MANSAARISQPILLNFFNMAKAKAKIKTKLADKLVKWEDRIVKPTFAAPKGVVTAQMFFIGKHTRDAAEKGKKEKPIIINKGGSSRD